MKPTEDQLTHAMQAAEQAAQDQIAFLMTGRSTFNDMGPAQAEQIKFALRHYARLGARAGVIHYSKESAAKE